MTEEIKMSTWEEDGGRIFGDVINLLYLDNDAKQLGMLRAFLDGQNLSKRKSWMHALDQVVDRALVVKRILVEKTIKDLTEVINIRTKG